MDRGPVALFGAIVAVGLGPALWLGAQFADVNVYPVRPPAVVGEQNVNTGKVSGGAGAATEEPIADQSTSRSNFVPLSGTPSVRPSSSAETRRPTPAGEPTTEPDTSTEPTPTPTDKPTTRPTENTTEPTGPTEPSTGGDTEDPSDPVPPAPDEPVSSAGDLQLAGR